MKISLSILDFDFANLESEITPLVNNIDYVHMDVMDGVFVPNLSFGLPVVKAVNKMTDAIIDTHLMINDPINYIKQFVDAGSDMITFHYESESNIDDTIDLIKSYGVKAGLSIKPNTPVEAVIPYLEKLDLVLIMSVEPGFGGQKFMESAIDKAVKLQNLQAKYHFDIFVDGGINGNTIDLISPYVDTVIVGSYVAKATDRIKTLKDLKSRS